MKIVRTHQMEWGEGIQQGNFSQRRKALGGDKLSCGLWELAPGKKSFPFHVHHVTEEALFVLSGKAKVRTSEGETPIGPGDYVSFPPSGLPHQLINDGTEPLIYVAMAAGQGVDIVEYPDSNKVSSSTGTSSKRKRFIFNQNSAVEYFAGETDAS